MTPFPPLHFAKTHASFPRNGITVLLNWPSIYDALKRDNSNGSNALLRWSLQFMPVLLLKKSRVFNVMPTFGATDQGHHTLPVLRTYSILQNERRPSPCYSSANLN